MLLFFLVLVCCFQKKNFHSFDSHAFEREIILAKRLKGIHVRGCMGVFHSACGMFILQTGFKMSNRVQKCGT